jgi:hypothetical protein
MSSTHRFVCGATSIVPSAFGFNRLAERLDPLALTLGSTASREAGSPALDCAVPCNHA